MKYLNQTLNKKIFLSILFPIILSIIIFYIYQIYFGNVNICDDNGLTLSQLNLQLKNEKDKFNHSIINKEIYWTLYQEYLGKPGFNEDNATEEYILNNLKDSRNSMNESLERINSIEKSIRKIDPNFKSNYRPCVGDYLTRFNFYPKN